MAKSKRNRKPLADNVYAKKSSAGAKSNPFALAKPVTSKKMNPFEVHVNREKFQILGRTCKHDKGLPGVSRAKAEKRRQQTLGMEYLRKHKTNQFRDKRIGRNVDADELTENIINARFLADKMSQLKQNKASKFNLNDDEVLTHRGTTLEEIEQFKDDRSDDDVDDEELNADFTEAAHFGGDSKTEKDRKTAIDEMILEQKKRKVESAKEKDELQDLTDKLDTNYRELLSVVGKMARKGDQSKPPQDDFDILMREMIFEPRGAVTDKLESVEETAKKEKERLENLENERLRRMQEDEDDESKNKKSKHRSADDLDDGYFAFGKGNIEETKTLTYNLEGTKLLDNGEPKESKEAEESGNDEDEEDIEAEEENESDSESDDENEDDNSDDDLSDLKGEDSDDETNAPTGQSNKVSKKKIPKHKIEQTKSESTELPFTIDMPSKYEEFFELLSKHTPTDQAIIVERLIKCNHPKLDGVNREKVVKMFAFLLQYINEIFGEATTETVAQQFQLLDNLNPQLYDLIHLNAEKMPTLILNVIKEKYTEYCKYTKQFPSLETIVFFKLVSNYFTTSDFRHPIVTPCFIFIEQILTRSRVRTRRDVATGLFLVTIILEYTQQSKRFSPAAFNFLLGALFLCIPKRAIEVLKVIPPFQSRGPLSNILVLDKSESELCMEMKENECVLKSEDLLLDSMSAEFKVSALNTCLRLIMSFSEIVGDNVGANYLAAPLKEMLERLPLELYPKFVDVNSSTAKLALSAVVEKPLIKLVPPEKKPKALRLFEPRFEAVYDDKRRPKMSKEKEEKAKLLHKIKRETKGAVREIRRDTEFIQKMRIQQQIQSDRVRQDKVRRIFHEASVQQGELNELARAKKRKKF